MIPQQAREGSRAQRTGAQAQKGRPVSKSLAPWSNGQREGYRRRRSCPHRCRRKRFEGHGEARRRSSWEPWEALSRVSFLNHVMKPMLCFLFLFPSRLSETDCMFFPTLFWIINKKVTYIQSRRRSCKRCRSPQARHTQHGACGIQHGHCGERLRQSQQAPPKQQRWRPSLLVA